MKTAHSIATAFILGTAALAAASAHAQDPVPARPVETLTDYTTLFAENECERSLVVCLDGDGNGLRKDAKTGRETVPANLEQGRKLTIKVIGCAARYQGVEFSLGLVGGRQEEQLFRVDYHQAGDPTKVLPDGEVRGASACDKSTDYAVLNSTILEVPATTKVQLQFERKAAKDPTLVAASQAYDARVLRPLYFLDISVAAPFVIGGKRRIGTRPVPDLDAHALTLEQGLLVAPALMLHVFPAGRRLGAISSFGVDRICPTRNEDPTDEQAKRCRRRNRARKAANSLGVQLGVGLDLEDLSTEFPKFYGGVFFEPVVGLNIGVGAAVLGGDELTDGHRIGELVAADQLNAYATQRFMVRPYISISVSFDIIRNVRAAAKMPEITKLAPD